MVAILVALAAVFAIGSGSVSAATPLRGTFGGESYGTYANVVAGPIAVQLGRSAYLTCPCNGTNNAVKRLSVDTVDVLNVFHADGIISTTQAGKSADGLTASLNHTSTITGVSALNGLIRADVIRAEAHTRADATFINSNGAGSSFVNLRINGTPIAATVAPNTRIDLAGLGYVRLRETTRIGDGRSKGGISVNMIHIFVTTANTLGIPIGTEIIVAHARSRYTRVDSAVAVGGSAWAADANLSVPLIANKVGMIAPVYVPCQGTNGAILTNNVNVTNVAGIITAGTAVSTAFGSVSATQALARTTARIESLRLLGGLVTADVVTSVSRSSWSTTTGGSTAGSSTVFTNLRILGLLRPTSVPPNTRVTLPLLGYVTLNEQVRTVDAARAKLKITAIHIVITAPLNVLGLPVGTEIRIAVARSSALAL